MGERQQLLESTCDVDGVEGEGKTAGVAFVGSVLARTEGCHAKTKQIPAE